MTNNSIEILSPQGEQENHRVAVRICANELPFGIVKRNPHINEVINVCLDMGYEMAVTGDWLVFGETIKASQEIVMRTMSILSECLLTDRSGEEYLFPSRSSVKPYMPVSSEVDPTNRSPYFGGIRPLEYVVEGFPRKVPKPGRSAKSAPVEGSFDEALQGLTRIAAIDPDVSRFNSPKILPDAYEETLIRACRQGHTELLAGVYIPGSSLPEPIASCVQTLDGRLVEWAEVECWVSLGDILIQSQTYFPLTQPNA